MSDQMTVIPPRSPAMIGAPHELTIEELVAQSQKIQQCMKLIMQSGEHYGVIPGMQGRDGKPPKPTLLKPGAEKLCLLFRLDPEYEVVREVHEPARISYAIRCVLFHIPTATRVASGLGACNSREEKYMRAAPKKCPKCGKETIFKAKEEHRGYYCWAKKGGCGATFDSAEDRKLVDEQPSGIKEPDDLDNTLLKMACKRALVAAVLNATAASDFFTQDLEDLTEKAAEVAPVAPKESSAATAASTTTTPAAAPRSQSSAASSSGPKPPARHLEVDPVVMTKVTNLLNELGWARPHAVNWLKKHFQADSMAKLSADQVVAVAEKLKIEAEAMHAEAERLAAEAEKGNTP